MIKPVSVGLRIFTILALMVLEIIMAPIHAGAKLLKILQEEVLSPLLGQSTKLLAQLEQSERELKGPNDSIAGRTNVTA